MYGSYVYYTTFLLFGRRGRTIFNHILIDPKYKDDVGLLEHEKVHVRQWYAHKILMPLRYLLSQKWRLQYEAEAYAVSAKYRGSGDLASWLSYYADILATQYRLKFSHNECYQILWAEYHKL